MYRGNLRDKILFWIFGDKIPFSKIIMISACISFLAVVLFKANSLIEFLGFSSSSIIFKPWTPFTYTFLGVFDPIGLLFSCYWLWIAGGSIERAWGTARFASFFIIMSALSAAGLFLGSLITGVPTSAVGLWLPLAGLTIAFAMLNPEQQILFFFVIPLKLKYLALLDAVIVLVTYGQMHLLIGLTALLGCAYAYWYVTSGASIGRRYKDDAKVVHVFKKKSRFQSLNPFKAIKDRRERKKLKDLFERSGFKDQ